FAICTNAFGGTDAGTGAWANAVPGSGSTTPMRRPPDSAAEDLRNSRREVMAPSSRFLERGRGALDCFADARIRAAAADVPRHRGVDLRVAGRLVLAEQRARRHHLSRLAIAALHDVLVDPCRAHGVGDRRLRRPEDALDGDDALALDGGDRRRARAHRLA